MLEDHSISETCPLEEKASPHVTHSNIANHKEQELHHSNIAKHKPHFSIQKQTVLQMRNSQKQFLELEKQR